MHGLFSVLFSFRWCPLLVAWGVLSSGVAAQVPAPDPAVLTLEEALDWALNNHPVGQIADAIELQGPAQLMAARGAFDPKIRGEWDRKEFLGKNYFDFGDVGVEWQSPYAFKVMGGHYWSDGIFLNDERTLPAAGQTYLGIKLPIIQGLVIDEARTRVQRGDIAVERQRALASVVRNELRYDVSIRYAEWLYAERALNILLQTTDLLERYLRDTRGLYRLGDKPAVDTLEASVYLNQQRLEVQQAEVDLQIAKLSFAELYWPLEPGTEPTVPSIDILTLPEPGDWLSNQPEILELQLSLADLQLEQRLKRQKLLPKLEAGYYLLGDGGASPISEGDQYGGPLTRAYKIEAKASFPIFNRAARGDVELGRLKLLETEAKLNAKQQAMQQKLLAYTNAALAYDGQIDQAELLIRQSRQLLDAEQTLFDLGESTQFLLNVRQQAYQKALLVAEKARFSRNKAVYTYRYLLADWD